MNSPYVVDYLSYNGPRRNLAAKNRTRTVCYYSLKLPLSNLHRARNPNLRPEPDL